MLFAVSLVPALDLVPAPRFWSPHYLYLPLVFLALGLANAVGELRRLALVAAPVLALLAVASWQQARRYHDDRALFEAELEQRPACREGWLYVGDARRITGDLDAAAIAYQRAVAPHPDALAYVDLAASWQNLGVVQLQRGELGDAETAFRTALTLADARAKRELTHDLAAARFAEGHADEAAQLLESETTRPDAAPASNRAARQGARVARAHRRERGAPRSLARALMRGRLWAKLAACESSCCCSPSAAVTARHPSGRAALARASPSSASIAAIARPCSLATRLASGARARRTTARRIRAR